MAEGAYRIDSPIQTRFKPCIDRAVVLIVARILKRPPVKGNWRNSSGLEIRSLVKRRDLALKSRGIFLFIEEEFT